jgi:hypothetical protein
MAAALDALPHGFKETAIVGHIVTNKKSNKRRK